MGSRIQSSLPPSNGKPILPKIDSFTSHIPVALGLMALVVMGGMAAVETALWIVFPHITVWKRHVLTILVSGMASVLAGYFVLRKRSELGVQVLKEAAERRRAEAESQKAKEAAHAASRAKDEFLAIMNHEIRTLLNGILGMTELALLTVLTDEQRDCLEMVKISADSLLTVTNDVLDFSKIEAGNLKLAHTEFNVRETLGTTMHVLDLWAHQKNLEIAFHVRPEVPETVVGDPTRLQQIIGNIVGDAIQFTEHGEVILEVGAGPETENGLSLNFTLTDTGIGIPVGKRWLDLESSKQADRSTAGGYTRWGLGLALSSRLMQMMGGRAENEKERGEESSFHFNARFGLSKNVARKVLPEEVTKLKEMSVLVVDDKAINRLILQEALAEWQLKAVLPEGGEAALKALQSAKDAGHPFPLVILDARMPDIDGFTLAHRIKQDPRLAGEIIMMLGSSDYRADVARCRALGVAAYLVKPIQQSDLLQAVQVSLGRAEAKAGQAAEAGRPLADEPGRKFRILLVEDNLVNQKLVARWLEKRGYEAVVAHNGREALDALEKRGPGGFDLALMDIQMPEMNGLVATAIIRGNEKATGEHLPIVALTAHTTKADWERCMAAGMDGFISKPVRAKVLFETIDGYVSSRAGVPTEKKLGEGLNWDETVGPVEAPRPLVAETMKLVRKESRNLLSAMREAIARQDPEALEQAAHALRTTVGFTAVNPFASVEEPVSALEEEFKLVWRALADLPKEIPR